MRPTGTFRRLINAPVRTPTRRTALRSTPTFRLTILCHCLWKLTEQLGSSIPLNRCREIKVSILNHDPRRGVLNLAVSLTDTTSPGKASVFLGQQPVMTSQPGNFTDRSRIDGSPAVNEVLHFEIPARAKIRKFDEITVTFLPDPMNIDVGPKIAVQDFELLPR